MNTIENKAEVESVRPLARVLARELTAAELNEISGGCGAVGRTRCGENLMHAGDTDDLY